MRSLVRKLGDVLGAPENTTGKLRQQDASIQHCDDSSPEGQGDLALAEFNER